MADFHISIEGMYTEDGELDLFNDRPEPIVPPKVQIKGNYEYLMTDQDGHQHRTNLTQDTMGKYFFNYFFLPLNHLTANQLKCVLDVPLQNMWVFFGVDPRSKMEGTLRKMVFAETINLIEPKLYTSNH